MSEISAKSNIVSLFPRQQPVAFSTADMLYAICWSNLAPGIDGWRLAIEDDDRVTTIGIIPPAAAEPVFNLTRKGDEVAVTRMTPKFRSGSCAVGQYQSLRHALMALCPLSEDAMEELNTRMEVVYPRSLRDVPLRLAASAMA